MIRVGMPRGALLAVLLACSNETPPPAPAVDDEPRRALQSSEPLRLVRTTCPTLETATGEAALPTCSGSAVVESCPTAEQIAFVIDADPITVKARTWERLLRRPVGVSSKVCAAEAGGPLAAGLPSFCASIQEVGASGFAGFDEDDHCQRADGSGLGGSLDRGSTTPAATALGRLCEQLASDSGPRVSLLAFDGVVDEGTRDDPAAAFGKAARTCAEKGIGLRVVADPQAYRYTWVLSAEGHHRYGDDLADGVQRLLGGTVLALTPHALTEVRASQARVGLSPGQAVPLDPVPAWEGHALQELRVGAWLGADQTALGQWDLSWTSQSDAVRSLAPAATSLRPPEVWTNLAAEDPAAPGIVGLSDCPARPGPPPDARCGSQVAVLLKGGAIEGSAADGSVSIHLLRSPDGFIPGEIQLTEPQRARLAGSRDAPLPVLVLVSPQLERDGEDLDGFARATRDGYAWKLSTRVRGPSTETGTPLGAVWRAAASARPRAFPSTSAGLVPTDTRGGVTSLAWALEQVTASLVQEAGPPEAWRAEAGDCVLGGLRVVYDCPAGAP